MPLSILVLISWLSVTAALYPLFDLIIKTPKICEKIESLKIRGADPKLAWVIVDKFFEKYTFPISNGLTISGLGSLIFFVLFVLSLPENLYPEFRHHFWYYLLAWIIVNGVGDFLSLLQSRKLVSLYLSTSAYSRLFWIVDFALSVLIFFALYSVSVSVNILFSGMNLSWFDQVLLNLKASLCFGATVQSHFAIWSITSALISTFFHFIAKVWIFHFVVVGPWLGIGDLKSDRTRLFLSSFLIVSFLLMLIVVSLILLFGFVFDFWIKEGLFIGCT